MSELDTEVRAVFFNQKCIEAGYRGWGKTQNLARDLNVTHGQVSNWLRGALPRGFSEIKRVADHLNIDIMTWIYGESKVTDPTVNLDKLKVIISAAKALERGYDQKLSAEDFAEVVISLLTDGDVTKATSLISKKQKQ